MLRFLALMMMCVMLLSHGTASVAATHAAGSAIGHTHHGDAETPDAGAVDRHDADQSGAAGEDSDQDIDLDVAHGHPAADKAHTGGLLPARLAMRDVRDTPAHDSPLTPIQSAPLLEPPTA